MSSIMIAMNKWPARMREAAPDDVAEMTITEESIEEADCPRDHFYIATAM